MTEASTWVGNVMIFTLVNCAQEYLRKEMEEEKDKARRLKDIEEEELKKKLEGSIRHYNDNNGNGNDNNENNPHLQARG